MIGSSSLSLINETNMKKWSDYRHDILDFQFEEQGKAGCKGRKEAQNQSLFSICRRIKIKWSSDNQAEETHFNSADQDH